MNIQEWIESVAGTTLRQVALATEIPVPTLARQVREQAVTPETVVRIARKYEASPLGGFVAIGLITDTEANAMSVAEVGLPTSSSQPRRSAGSRRASPEARSPTRPTRW